MTGIKERAGTVLQIVGKAVGAGLKSFAKTTLALAALTVVLLGASLGIARAAGGWAMLAAAALALVGGGVVWWIVASKRAVVAALGAGVQQSELGRHSMELIFDRLLQVDAAEEVGERGRRPAEVAERLPLRQAEERLTAVVDRVLAEPSAQTGLRAWLARKIRVASLRQVQRVTLEELRDEDTRHGGVDLVQVRDKLAGKIDKKLLKILRKAAQKVTILALAVLIVVTLGGALGLRILFLY